MAIGKVRSQERAAKNRSNDTLNDRPQDWNAALADYRRLQSVQEAVSSDDQDAFDAAVSATFDAAKHLVYNVPAPDVAALLIKIEVMIEVISLPVDVIRSDAHRVFAAMPAANGSLIRQLHRRYEQIWDAHNRVDLRQPPKDGEGSHSEFYACERAMGELADESSLLVRLLLRQVPSTQEDLAIVSLHLAQLYEDHFTLPEEDRKAISIAIDQCFDFQMGEGWADSDALGRIARDTTMHAWKQRRYREGRFDVDG